MRKIFPLAIWLEMKTAVLTLAAALLLVGAAPAQAAAATQPERMDWEAAETFVAYHNLYRTDVGLQNLTWSTNLYKQALVRVASCALVHATPGENLYAGGPISYDNIRTARITLKAWYEEQSKVDKEWLCAWKTGKCGHYSQIVWKKTARVGCAINHCPPFPNFVICLYDPPGNKAGEKPH